MLKAKRTIPFKFTTPNQSYTGLIVNIVSVKTGKSKIGLCYYNHGSWYYCYSHKKVPDCYQVKCWVSSKEIHKPY